MTCGRCGGARYCSKECQQAAYPEHKATCVKIGKNRLANEFDWMFGASKALESSSIQCMPNVMMNLRLAQCVKEREELNEKGVWLSRKAFFAACALYSAVTIPYDPNLERCVETAIELYYTAIKADQKNSYWASAELVMIHQGRREPLLAQKVVENALKHNPVGMIWSNPLQLPIAGAKGLRAQPYWPSEMFTSWTLDIEAFTKTIRDEMAEALNHNKWIEESTAQALANGENPDRARVQGFMKEVDVYELSSILGRPSKTWKLLERILPQKMFKFAEKNGGEIVFTRLGAHSHKKASSNVTNTRLTAILPLSVPKNSAEPVTSNMDKACAIRVGSEWRTFEEGHFLIIDDSFEHEEINNTPDERWTLLIRFWHPDLPLEKQDTGMADAKMALLCARYPPRYLRQHHRLFPKRMR